jgi:glutathione S-transferase
MTLVLMHAARSTCSQKVRMALYEKGLDWVSQEIDLRKNEHLTPEYLKLNPNGVVPTLVHDGDAIVESSVILEYLDDVFAEPPLRPAGAKPLARMRAWRQYIDEVPTPAIRVPSFQAFIRRTFKDGEAFEAEAARRPIRKHFYLKMKSGAFSEQDLAEAQEKLQQTIDRMESSLADGRPWLCGDMFTHADICVMPNLVRLDDLKMSGMWAQNPNVTAWYERLQERPAFAKTYAKPAREIFSYGGPQRG